MPYFSNTHEQVGYLGGSFRHGHHMGVDDNQSVLVHDAWAAPPIAPGLWDMDLAPSAKSEQLPAKPLLYSFASLPMSGLGTPVRAVTQPPTRRPCSWIRTRVPSSTWSAMAAGTR